MGMQPEDTIVENLQIKRPEQPKSLVLPYRRYTVKRSEPRI